ncbi:MAG: C10 family peptidase [Bacteroidaceae bacterium]|nr:C10 family peptidase [Bacteroidaceae bacterium]
MRKVYLSFLTLCLAIVATAEPIGKQAALYTAKLYMLAKGKSLDVQQATVSGRMKASPSGEAEEGEPYYYVFNAGNDGGYVIVSGDDRTEPILGYVEQGSFDPDNIPENMRSWLQLYADQIKFIVDNDINPASPLLKKRNKAQATKHSIAELLTTRWNQGHPYNLTCPKYYKGDGSQAYPAAGCVATAMSQVVYYYKFPEKTKAIIPAHSNKYTLDNGTEKTVTMKAIPRNTKIDWENMRDTYNCNDEHIHDRADTAVANLMLYCGQGVKMGYGGSSGAVSSRSRDFFVDCFGYNASAYWGGRGSYSIDEWFDMLYHEIELGYPVLYAGHSSGGGHAFVLDGFDGDNLFHVNWGWGGGSNGWFLVSILNPGDNSGIGASSSSDGYSMSQGALFGLRTPQSPQEDPSLSISDVSVVGSTSIRATFTNKTGSRNSFHTGIVMLNEDGSLALVGTRQSIVGMENDASQTKTFNLRGKLTEGIYRLSPASKSSKNEVWHTKYDMQHQYIEAIVDSLGTLELHFNTPTYEDICIDTITFPGTRIAGKEQEVKVTFRNNGAEYFKTIYMHVSKTANVPSKDTYADSKSQVAVRSGETLDVSYFFKPEETGTYNLWFCTDDKGNNVMGTGTMEVIAEEDAVKANLAITKYEITNGSGEVAYGKCLVGKASIKNNGKTDYHGGIKLQIWSQKIGASTAWSGSSRTYSVDILAGKVATIEFEFNNLNEGYYYRLKAMYTNQDGTLTSGGIWDHKWEAKAGVLTWKSNGTIGGLAYKTSMTTSTTLCGIYADCNNITRLTPNKNPNTIYAFAADMKVPASLDTCNAVCGNHASHINLKADQPYYIPVSFEADTATFTYTFPETEAGTGWHAFTLPFKADSIFIDDEFVSLEDTTKHFWIYEFAAQSSYGDIVFTPATGLRGATPYIIAADETMAGRSIVFRSLGASFYKSGTDKMLVTTSDYKFHGNTYAPQVRECYILNEEGTAFDYVTTTKTLTALTSYFTTVLPEETRLPSIVLPEVPIPTSTPDGIDTIHEDQWPMTNGDIYNLAGQRLNRQTKGIIIVNGKKIYRR